ncbi:hypothetical protein [Alkalinema sp. FACHB-956]|nr:hypothetical protein [Alkalinema sp. FACHB-956]
MPTFPKLADQATFWLNSHLGNWHISLKPLHGGKPLYLTVRSP